VALSLVDDPAVRVREAAMLALSKANVEAPLEAKLAERVALDPWAFVRLQAAAALESGKSEPVNVRVGAAVDLEPLEKVRAAMVTALGVRRAKSQRLVVLSRATDEKEALFVRTSALVALGKMCDSQSLELLTELALGGATLQLERERRLSLAALEGLAALSPSDIATRIAPLLKEGATPDIREMARRAVKPASPSPCVR
jgi:HEAT repeat protein